MVIEKSKMNFPIYIPVYNNPTYTNYFVEQLYKKNCKSINIIDNNSDYPPMIKLLKKLEDICNIIK